jgi:uncharacterized damage-inducible protein DinB
MNLTDIRQLYAYTEWANERILESIRGLSEDQLTRTLESSFPTIRATMAHIVMAEWVWLQRWKGVSPTAVPEWARDAALETIEENLHAIEAERAALIASLDDDALQRELSYRKIDGTPHVHRIGDLMLHVANHSTYHRGQLTTMLRQVGAKPPSTDLIVYLR